MAARARLWLHADPAPRAALVEALGARLDREGIETRATGRDIAAPGVDRAAVRAVLGADRPDIFAQLGGPLDPGLLGEIDRAGLPRLLLNCDEDGLALTVGGWRLGLRRSVIGQFAAAHAITSRAGERLRRAGLLAERIAITGPLDETPPALPYVERDRADLSKVIGPRPVWLAAEVPLSEAAVVAGAQRVAGRRTHRLLMIATPAGDDSAPLVAAFRDAGLRVASQFDGDDPREETEVFVADGAGETGLWLRLAPITYLGGTLSDGPRRSPLDAANLGSALILGPARGDYAAPISRLVSLAASRPIRDGEELGPAVEQLLSPDSAARLAHSAWDVVSAGAEATEAAVAAILRALGRS